MTVEKFAQAPASESCRLIDFDQVDILESNPQVLVVQGEAPCFNMEVSLQPVIYARCPEYWRIEVVGCLPGAICLTAIKPFRVFLSLDGIIGSEGIEVAGANRCEQIDLTGGCEGALSANVAL